MTDRTTAVTAYTTALTRPDEHNSGVVASVLTEDVVVETNFGRAEGVAAAVALLREPRTARVLAAGARWSQPTADGDRVVVTAALPPDAAFSGLELAFQFRGDKIARVEQQTLPPAPLPPRSLRIDPEIKAAVDGALDNRTPMLIAYLDEDQQIHMSFRGTIQAYSDDQLALWAREPEGGLPRNIGDRPRVTLSTTIRPAGRPTRSTAGRGSSMTRRRARRFSRTPIRASSRWTSGATASRSSLTWTRLRAVPPAAGC